MTYRDNHLDNDRGYLKVEQHVGKVPDEAEESIERAVEKKLNQNRHSRAISPPFRVEERVMQ